MDPDPTILPPPPGPRPVAPWLRRGSQFTLTLLPVVILLTIAILSWQRGLRNPVSPQAVTPSNPRIELRLLDVELRGRKAGSKTWAIWAREVEVSRDQNSVYLKGKPHGTFYNIKDWSRKESPAPLPPAVLPAPAGTGFAIPPPPVAPRPTASPERLHTIKWRAQIGEYTFAHPGITEQLVLRGDVAIESDERDTVSTREVQWLPEENRLICPTRTRLRAHEGTVIEADRAVTNTQLEVLELYGKIDFTVPVKRHQEL